MDFIQGIFDTSNWPARWQCGIWSPLDGWLYILSDLLTFSAYMAIPIILWYFLKNHKGDTPFKNIIWLFVLFIFFCGLTHLSEVIIFWYPFYRFSALLRLATGIVSLFTAIMLYKRLPEALKFKSPKELENLVKLRTRELNEKELELSLLIDNLPEMVFRVDESFDITIANKSFFETKDNLGKNLSLMNLRYLNFDDSIIEKFENYVMRAFESEKTQFFDFYRVLEGKYNYYQAKVVYELIGKNKFALCIISDISNLKFKEIELKRLLNERENISRIMVHDIKSPLGTINKLSNVAKESANEESVEIFGAIEKTSSRAISIMEDLLGLSILFETAPQEKILSTLLIKKIIKQNERLAGFKNIKIEFINNFETSLDVIPILMERALENLLNNSIKFSDRDSKIIIKTSGNVDYFIVEVQDFGIGIPENLREKLFNFKTEASRLGTEGEASTGIGLNLVNSIVKNHNGIIELDSKEGVGSTFRIKLPI